MDSLEMREGWFRRRATMRDAGLFLFISMGSKGYWCQWAKFLSWRRTSLSISSHKRPTGSSCDTTEALRRSPCLFLDAVKRLWDEVSVVKVAILADENSSRPRLTEFGLGYDLDSTNESSIDTAWYSITYVLPTVTA